MAAPTDTLCQTRACISKGVAAEGTQWSSHLGALDVGPQSPQRAAPTVVILPTLHVEPRKASGGGPVWPTSLHIADQSWPPLPPAPPPHVLLHGRAAASPEVHVAILPRQYPWQFDLRGARLTDEAQIGRGVVGTLAVEFAGAPKPKAKE